MIAELDRAILLIDMPEHGLETGDIGTVVHIYSEQQACELEFFTVDDQTVNIVTVEAKYLRPVSDRDMLHARRMNWFQWLATHNLQSCT